MAKVLGKKFYCRPALTVAKDLLGKFLVCDVSGSKVSKMITEVEAYDGPNDLASHASRGKTDRTEIMFEGGGIWYVYFVYGMHYMLNIVVGPPDYPAAILIRGVGPVVDFGIAEQSSAALRRNAKTHYGVEGINGPARVTKFFGVDKKLNGQPASKKSGLYIEDQRIKINPKDIKKSARVGVAYAGSIWSKKKYRFFINQS